MTKRNLLVPSCESHLDPLPSLHVSVEEENLALVEGIEASNKAKVLMEEMERSLQVSETMDDAALVIADVEEVTPEVSQMVDLIGKITTAGTDTPVSDVVPSLESYIGTKVPTVSVESLQDRARQIWKFIQEKIKQIREWMRQFWNGLTTVAMTKRRIGNLREKIKKIEKDGNIPDLSSKTVFRSGMNTALQINGKPVADAGELAMCLNRLRDTAVSIYDRWPDRTVHFGQVLIQEIKGFEFGEIKKLEDPQTNASSLSTMASRLNKEIALGLSGFSYSAHATGNIAQAAEPGYTATDGPQLLGNHHLHVRYPTDDVNDLGGLERSRNSGVTFIGEQDRMSHPASAGAETIHVPKLKDVDLLLAQVENILKLADEYRRGSKVKKLEQIGKDIETASAQLSKVHEKAQPTAVVDQYYRSLLNFNLTYQRWASSPAADMTKLIIRVVNSVVPILRSMVNLYEHGEAAATPSGTATTQHAGTVPNNQAHGAPAAGGQPAPLKDVDGYTPPSGLKAAVQKRDVKATRAALQKELKNRATSMDNLKHAAKFAEQNVNGLWDAFEVKSGAPDINMNRVDWTRGYLGIQLGALQNNFSKDRFNHLLLVREAV